MEESLIKFFTCISDFFSFLKGFLLFFWTDFAETVNDHEEIGFVFLFLIVPLLGGMIIGWIIDIKKCKK